jgi:hypothetical protein
MSVQHGAAYRGVLYRSRHRVEYAVFTPDDAPSGRLERHLVLIDRANIAALAVASQQLRSGLRTPSPSPCKT